MLGEQSSWFPNKPVWWFKKKKKKKKTYNNMSRNHELFVCGYCTTDIHHVAQTPHMSLVDK